MKLFEIIDDAPPPLTPKQKWRISQIIQKREADKQAWVDKINDLKERRQMLEKRAKFFHDKHMDILDVDRINPTRTARKALKKLHTIVGTMWGQIRDYTGKLENYEEEIELIDDEIESYRNVLLGKGYINYVANDRDYM